MNQGAKIAQDVSTGIAVGGGAVNAGAEFLNVIGSNVAVWGFFASVFFGVVGIFIAGYNIKMQKRHFADVSQSADLAKELAESKAEIERLKSKAL